MAWLIGAALAAASLGVALAVWIGPPLSLATALAWRRTEPWLSRFQGEVVVEELAVDADGRRLPADLYRSGAPGGALVLVHGLSPKGRRHPDIVRLARLLARHHRLVLVPQIEGLATFRLDGQEVADVRAALRALAARSRSVGIAGFSFGAGPTLLAAAEVPGLSLVATFGGYADLRNVMVFLATGVHRFDGRRYVQAPDESNRWKFLALLAAFVEDEHDRRLLEQIAARRLVAPGVDTAGLESDLGPTGRAMRALALNRQEEAIAPLFAALPAPARAAIERLSPLRVLPRVTGRLLFVHGAADATIPFTESLRLAEASGGRTEALILESYTHIVTPPFWASLGGRIRDGRRLLRLADALLSDPEGSPRRAGGD